MSTPNFIAASREAYGCVMVSKHLDRESALLEPSTGIAAPKTRALTTSGLTGKGLAFQLAVCSSILLACIVIASVFGSTPVHLRDILNRNSTGHEVFFVLRLPRAFMAALAGGSLALAGVLFQALLRDSLATPYTLGVSSGASLGAVVAICLGWNTLAGFSAVPAFSLVGAGLVLLAISRVASRGGMSSQSLLLAGITMNSICGAVIIFLQSITSFTQSLGITRWLMGELDAPEYGILAELSVILIPACLVAWWFGRAWNLLAIGDDWANARGIPARKFLIIGFLIGSVVTAAVTAYTGPIGFVGLIVPHALRLKFGADHRVLIPCSFLLGGAFLVLSDLVSRVLLAPTEIPVGVITALVGGPVFIWMLYSRETHRGS